jgi:hypothetical protein
VISKIWAVALVPALVAPAYGADAERAPAALAPLLECRRITEATARLACFDSQSATLDAATSKREVVVIDAAEARRVKRSLFGFNVPKLNLLGRDNDSEQEEAEDNELEARIQRTYQRSDARWVFLLDDGAMWVQTDSIVFRAEPKAGDVIRIRRAAMGSYLAKVNKQLAVRVRRENR